MAESSKCFLYKGNLYEEGQEVMVRISKSFSSNPIKMVIRHVLGPSITQKTFMVESDDWRWCCAIYGDNKTSSDFPQVFEPIREDTSTFEII